MICVKCGSDFPGTHIPEWLQSEPWLCRTCLSLSAAVEREVSRVSPVSRHEAGVDYADRERAMVAVEARRRAEAERAADAIIFEAREFARKEAH